MFAALALRSAFLRKSLDRGVWSKVEYTVVRVGSTRSFCYSFNSTSESQKTEINIHKWPGHGTIPTRLIDLSITQLVD